MRWAMLNTTGTKTSVARVARATRASRGLKYGLIVSAAVRSVRAAARLPPREFSIMPLWKENNALRIPVDVAFCDQVSACSPCPFASRAQA